MICCDEYMTRRDGVVLVRTYSDRGVRIRQLDSGAVYDYAIDPADAGREYEETDLPLEAGTTEEDM